MPSTSPGGVDNALPKPSFPDRSSKTATSVKVPPISAASLTPGRVAVGADLFPMQGPGGVGFGIEVPVHTLIARRREGWGRILRLEHVLCSRSRWHGVWVPAFAGM